MRELVAVDLPAGPAFVRELRRAWDDGDAVLPLQQEAPPAHRRATADRLGATVLVDGSGRHRLHGGWPVEEGDAVVMATSGTTGEPKGAVHTHAGVEAAAFATATALGVDPDCHWLACLPLSHVGGLSVVTRALATGAGLTVNAGFDAAAVDRAPAAGATHVSLVPTALQRVDASRWRRILVGGARAGGPLPPNCTATYGMTETFGGVVHDGLALNGVQVRIAGAATDEIGRTGPIEIRSPSLLRAYRRRPGAPGQDPDPVGEDGWFRTGDLGVLDGPDRRLRVLGRQDALIVTGGEKVWPEAVEAVIEAHPAVAEAAVFGRPDPEWGQRVTALVVPQGAGRGPSRGELADWVRERLPVAAAPKELHVVDGLPRTALGKLRRGLLAAVAPADPARDAVPCDAGDSGDRSGSGRDDRG
jgi:O-succinylbenzoic acid--CoA ligase